MTQLPLREQYALKESAPNSFVLYDGDVVIGTITLTVKGNRGVVRGLTVNSEYEDIDKVLLNHIGYIAQRKNLDILEMTSKDYKILMSQGWRSAGIFHNFLNLFRGYRKIIREVKN